ncbi:hypothetical protein KGM_210748 [Danaus plexippus plexippus]|uniref:Uncharacterized protein n=1 Tax=Danaus plexippus plexippus TaxID=278856 RepID=A0A212F6M9_DANPL|nr:uncharacterized protein LOC116769099 [Danaus plexippus plexippus]OWR49383.1 hypothetical protein KGM_210748 [Danaus plexippus plexippus]
MSVKLFSVLVLAMITQTLGQDEWSPWAGNEGRQSEEEACDKAYCVHPCPGSSPPNYCPPNFTDCSSGCACMLECTSPTYVCYETKYCRPRRRFLPNKNTPVTRKRLSFD